MITIALDEQGNFESLYDEKKTGAPIFIGGLVFDELGDERVMSEEKFLFIFRESVKRLVEVILPLYILMEGIMLR